LGQLRSKWQYSGIFLKNSVVKQQRLITKQQRFAANEQRLAINQQMFVAKQQSLVAKLQRFAIKQQRLRPNRPRRFMRAGNWPEELNRRLNSQERAGRRTGNFAQKPNDFGGFISDAP
jgi:hypothetical protein